MEVEFQRNSGKLLELLGLEKRVSSLLQVIKCMLKEGEKFESNTLRTNSSHQTNINRKKCISDQQTLKEQFKVHAHK